MCSSHFNDLFNAEKGFDLDQIEQMTDGTLKFFIENMEPDDIVAFSNIINHRYKRLFNLKEKLELYVTFS